MKKFTKIILAALAIGAMFSTVLPTASIYADTKKDKDYTRSEDTGASPDDGSDSSAGTTGDADGGASGTSGSGKAVDTGSNATCTTHFLGLKAWYDGLVEDDCSIKDIDQGDTEEMKRFIWTAILNVVSSVLGVVGYLAIGFVIWGGVLYMTAQGDPGKVAKGKKTIVNTLIGLIIVMSASIISGAIAGIVSGANKSNSKDFFNDIFGTFFVWVGIIAVIMMVYGGIQYITSTGNPAGIQKAKTTILYAAVGLAVAVLAGLIVGVVVNGI